MVINMLLSIVLTYFCIAISTLVNGAQVFQNFNVDTKETFMDSIYGELVRDDATEAHKAEMLAKGEILRLQSSDVKQSDKLHSMFAQMKGNSLDVYNNFEMYSAEITALKAEAYHNRAHSGYMRSANKLKFPEDDDTSDFVDGSPVLSLFGGISTFAHLPTMNCFDPQYYDKEIDIALVGAPFDTGTTFRPGARFGPESIRTAARRLSPYDLRYASNKQAQKEVNFTMIDCGDVPMTTMDNRIALNQLYRATRAIYNHPSKSIKMPKVITLGGDHTITLMSIKSAYQKYGKVAVIHFDSHIDTWDPKVLGGGISSYISLNHGTFLHYAHEQGYLADKNFHVGIRAPLIAPDYDKEHDAKCGFHIFSANDLDVLGKEQIIKSIRDAVGSSPVYISLDIDVLDPSSAPGTGTMEVGGFNTRELLGLLEGLQGINLVGADVVEVSPPFDTNSGITSLAATEVVKKFIRLMGGAEA